MAEKVYDVVGIGNAIVDIIGRCDEAFLAAVGVSKGNKRFANVARQVVRKVGVAVAGIEFAKFGSQVVPRRFGNASINELIDKMFIEAGWEFDGGVSGHRILKRLLIVREFDPDTGTFGVASTHTIGDLTEPAAGHLTLA